MRCIGVCDQVAIHHAVRFEDVDHLTAADPGMEEVRTFPDGEDAQDRAPRLAHEVDLLLAEADAQVLRELDDVGDRPIDRHPADRVNRGVRLPVAALVEVDEHEVLDPPRCHGSREAQVRLPGAAGEVEEDGIVRIGGSDHDGVVGAAEAHRRQLGKAARDGLAIGSEDRRRRSRPRHEHGQGDRRQPCDDGAYRPRDPDIRVADRAHGERAAGQHPERHGQDGKQCVHATGDDERHDPVAGIEANVVDGRADHVEPAGFETERISDRERNQDQASVGQRTAEHPDEEARAP